MKRTIVMTLFNGSPALMDESGKLLLSGIHAGVEYTGNTYNQLFASSEGDWSMIGSEKEGILRCSNVSIEYHQEQGGIALRTTYTHVQENIKAGKSLHVLRGLWHCGFERILQNDSCSYTGVAFHEMEASVHTLRFSDSQRITSAENAALIDREGQHLLVGYLSFEEYFSNIQFGSEGLIQAYGQLEECPVPKGTVLTGDWLYIGLCDDVRWGLMDYARLAAKTMHSRAGIADTPYGYCTWYYYGNGIKPKDIQENLKTLSDNRERLDVKYFNIDDGWYKEWGDWSENEKFACGMKKIADDIRAEGYLPGIWLAPYGGRNPSRLYREHPDWFVQKRDGTGPAAFPSLYGDFLSIDMSHPEVKSWMQELYHKISYDWGYRHIKIDIITPTLIPGKYYDPTFNTMKNFREGLRLIREAITEDTVLLTCTAPMGASIGYADGIRTSQDIFEDWNCLLPLFNQNLKRYYYNKIWYNNDPDCLLVRNAANEDADCIRQCTRTDEENRTFATALMATGGAMIMSDKMPLLKEYQLELLKKMFPINTTAAIPLDLMESEVPGILDLGRRERTHIYVLINWTEAPKEMSIDLRKGHVFEFWSQEYLGLMQGFKRFQVNPHGVKLLFVTDQNPISVIGADDCLCPTLQQNYHDGTLTGQFIKKGENLWVVAEAPIREVIGCTIEKTADGLYRVSQTDEEYSFSVSL